MSNKGTFADYAYISFGIKGTKDYKLYIFDTSEIAKQDPSGDKWHGFLFAINKLMPKGGITKGGIGKEAAIFNTANLEFKDGGFVEIK